MKCDGDIILYLNHTKSRTEKDSRPHLMKKKARNFYIHPPPRFMYFRKSRPNL